MGYENSFEKHLYNHKSNELPDYISSRVDAHWNRIVHDWDGGHLLHGKAPGKNSILLSSNDYLSLLGEDGLHARIDSPLNPGSQLLMSAVFVHGDSVTARTEEKLAKFLGAPDVVICQSGWAANVGLIQTIAGPDVPVYIDLMAHMSLWRGVHASGARATVFAHNNVKHAEQKINRGGPGILIVDTVYSTNGSLCPLADFVALAQRTGCVIVVDESHSLGTHGPSGRGLVVEQGLCEQVHFRTSSLAKAFATRAGLITCSTAFKSYFASTSFPAIFSSSILDHEMVWLGHVADFIEKADERRSRLHAVARHVRPELAKMGYDVSSGTEQIIALEGGPERKTLALRDALQNRDVFGAVFCAPATAPNRSLIRLSMQSALSDEDVERLLRSCHQAMADLKGVI